MADCTGQCECGGVRFSVRNPRPTVTVCHCGQCRRTSGHLWAATRADDVDITFHARETLSWFASSDHAKRGFCNRCGSSLFYKPNGSTHMGIAAGSLDRPTEMTLTRHIYLADKGDYYQTPTDGEVSDQ